MQHHHLKHIAAIKDNSQILVLMTLINCFVLANHILKGNIKHGIGYFVFFYVAVLAIYTFTNRVPPRHNIEVKEPKKELTIAILFACLGLVFLFLNFMLKAKAFPDKIFTKIPIGLGNLFFATPFGIFIYLLLKRYKFMALGFTTKPLLHIALGICIWAITGIIAYMCNPDGMLWSKAYKEMGGLLGIILQGVIGAALFEEFNRFIIQSRFAGLFKTSGMGILFATTIWAFMHFPVNYSKGCEVADIILYCVQIIPLGFVWGYLTERTKSIVPSIFAHGFNLWGLQNG
ncbi:MAG: hypothetical protein RL660_2650 [Bacteroidota bacterium]|jgi:membrane protease YdiL (CAAX protease family)